ncbi:MAG: hypothetical protein EZS28_013409 [Streblomastix strix]|uniref:Oxidation resistance protein 1 n=1 Tax=Streblomastix strix TaxID=222440 RepID=A0A5J4W8P8_9EUKA|nr:MAG: hypothetical protein EZS28_013409 [Streblomastix strix]
MDEFLSWEANATLPQLSILPIKTRMTGISFEGYDYNCVSNALKLDRQGNKKIYKITPSQALNERIRLDQPKFISNESSQSYLPQLFGPGIVKQLLTRPPSPTRTQRNNLSQSSMSQQSQSALAHLVNMQHDSTELVSEKYTQSLLIQSSTPFSQASQQSITKSTSKQSLSDSSIHSFKDEREINVQQNPSSILSNAHFALLQRFIPTQILTSSLPMHRQISSQQSSPYNQNFFPHSSMASSTSSQSSSSSQSTSSHFPYSWRLLFNMNVHGTSFSTLYALCILPLITSSHNQNQLKQLPLPQNSPLPVSPFQQTGSSLYAQTLNQKPKQQNQHLTGQNIETPVLIVMRTENGAVLGAFICPYLKIFDRYYGYRESFVFRFLKSNATNHPYPKSPERKKIEQEKEILWLFVHQSSRQDIFYVRCQHDNITIGGGKHPAITLHKPALERGATYSNTTYACPSLANSEDFVFTAFEVWRLE